LADWLIDEPEPKNLAKLPKRYLTPLLLFRLALANRDALAELLFRSAWKSLSTTIRREQGYEPASLMVLHTWNQKLDAHWHIHALVPAGGPAVSDGSWKVATSPRAGDDANEDNNDRPSRKYLVDAINLRRSFRKHALRHLKRLRRDGKLQFGGTLEHLSCDDQWKTFVQKLGDVEWVSHITPPQSESSRAENIVRYLTRYLTGGPISDHRILAANDETVTFLAREGRITGGERQQVPDTLSRDEFVRRWCLHIQSDQLTKTRYFGGWSNTLRKAYLQRCREALSIAGLCILQSAQDPTESKSERLAESAPLKCEHCSSESLTLIKKLPKPSWKAIFHRNSVCRPQWYSDWQRANDREFWDGQMGEGFSDFYEWHLKTQAESAKQAARLFAQPPRHQLWLAGMESTGTYQAISL
jgi:hypothetical protein